MMKMLLFPLMAIAVLAGLFVWMRPAPAPAPPVVAAAPAPTLQPIADAVPPPVPAAPAVQVFEIAVQKGQRVSGPEVISVPQGTPVTLRVTVDHHDELHLHGYDLTLKLPTNQAAELSFVADRSGRFEYELHHAHAGIGVLEVQPR